MDKDKNRAEGGGGVSWCVERRKRKGLVRQLAITIQACILPFEPLWSETLASKGHRTFNILLGVLLGGVVREAVWMQVLVLMCVLMSSATSFEYPLQGRS
eukprot:TRINITY_DN3314_c1_g1_i3.p1 TRINITY_DN3314_c1_g1~~TRINITY_DN3314_c1_g1_i3.p1  ORF type:complete len:100 (-),score=0.86 TRINITY_DN3314_c1_g1_i3:7-306(-)